MNNDNVASKVLIKPGTLVLLVWEANPENK